MLYPLPAFGAKGAALRIKQIYYCANTRVAKTGHRCPLYRSRIESWLTPADARRLVNPLGLLCRVCEMPLKWQKSEPIFRNPQPKEDA